MSEYTWNADAFDAIRIVAPNGEFEIVGADTNQVELECEGRRHKDFNGEPTIRGRWLELYPVGGGNEWALTLPKSKAWVVELMCGSGEVQIEEVHARFHVQLGSGDIQLENCRGVFQVRSGSGDVAFENCVQADAPAVPARPTEKEYANGVPPVPPVPPAPGAPPMPPIPPIGIKMKFGKGVSFQDETDWDAIGNQWGEWGERFAEQASRWAEKFSFEFGTMFKFGEDEQERADGIHVRLGSGDIQIEEVDAQLVTARIGSGDIQIELGRIAELDLETSRGDTQIEGVLPTSAWELVTRHGDIQLVLPGDAYVRIDAATRHGEIECDESLVRVGRPGPGARHGGRMVGTIGEGAGEPVDIHLESQHGDIQIEMERRASRYAGQPAPQSKNAERAVTTREPVVPTATRQETPKAVVPVTVTDLSEPEAALNPPTEKRVQVYDSQFAILQALQAGEITVAEAEMLLRSLKS